MVSTFIDAGIFAIIVMESLPSLMRRHLCRHQASIIALAACHQAGIVALVVMALSLLMRRCLHNCCDGNFCSHHNGIVAFVNAQASLPLSS
jgi:hypothetical protein